MSGSFRFNEMFILVSNVCFILYVYFYYSEPFLMYCKTLNSAVENKCMITLTFVVLQFQSILWAQWKAKELSYDLNSFDIFQVLLILLSFKYCYQIMHCALKRRTQGVNCTFFHSYFICKVWLVTEEWIVKHEWGVTFFCSRLCWGGNPAECGHQCIVCSSCLCCVCDINNPPYRNWSPCNKGGWKYNAQCEWQIAYGSAWAEL